MSNQSSLIDVIKLAAKTGKLYVGSDMFAEIQSKSKVGSSAIPSMFGEIEVILVNSLEPRAILATKPRGE